MRAVTLLGLALLLSLPSARGFAASTKPALDADAVLYKCADEYFTTVEIGECLAKAERDSEKNLKLAEEQVSSKVSEWYEEDEYIQAAKDKFIASNEEFVKYRKIHCEYSHSLVGGSLGHERIRAACVAGLNNLRADMLRKEIADIRTKEEVMKEVKKWEKRQKAHKKIK
jgi:hypothetical protein